MALYKHLCLSPSTSFNLSFSSGPKKSHLKRISHQNLIYAFSAEKPRKKKGRPSRAALSDEDLCKELREVMLVAGLPADRVPLMKELCEHGRNDLANIVRRKGYKVVRMLLSNYDLSDNHRENSSVEDQERSDPHEFEETHLRSAGSISSLSVTSVVEDCTAETNGTMKNDTPFQIVESSRSSIGPANFVAGYSYQKNELDMNVSGTTREVHALEEELLPVRHIAKSELAINQAEGIETNEDLASNMVFAEDDSKTEIDHLKALLRQKEMELVELKQHIEKEKQALTLLQARAQNEIGNVHRVILTKDTELHASKDELSGLKEVQVQFCVIGETVEVAGSFNGWHKRIKMNPHPSSRTVDLQDSRVSKLWSTILWLYPGTYETLVYVSQAYKVVLPDRVIDYDIITVYRIESNIVGCSDPEYAQKIIDDVQAIDNSVCGVMTCILTKCDS
ncbi:uncharacterized protein LOC110030107 isoform X2 [Phalaenopsis equestris]|uniref:uncharacterized protein LOC110030107 isoform X2 n=1 Tax=Phalaenopsis equestris TaxID=78828 RepID=UPI0009E246AC|nr:uncharacterized protein LOC110030107 isoform X2 [Phalaenopsis equestris]